MGVSPPQVQCPYCEHSLPTMPKARRKCPSCRGWIYLRRENGDPRPQLLTGDQAKRFDAERRRHYEEEARREADRRWADFNRQLLEAMRRNDWGAMAGIHFEQAFQLWREGKAFFHVLQEAAKAHLRMYSEYEVEISVAGDNACHACRALRGKKLSVTEALKEMPIPVASCTTDINEFGQRQGWCRCLYRPIIPQ